MPVVEKNMNPDEGLDDILKVVIKDLNLVNDNTPSVDIFDLDYLEARIKQVSFEEQTSVPTTYCHFRRLNAFSHIMQGLKKDCSAILGS